MTELLTAAQMRAIEAAAIASGEVTGLELMERAGQGVVDAIFAEWPDLAAGSFRAAVLCGPGGNGGDGFVVARLLKEWGWDVEVFLYGDSQRMPLDARVNHERWLGMGEVISWNDPQQRLRLEEGPEFDLVVDALFGIGLTRPIPDDMHATMDRLMPGPLRDRAHQPRRTRVVAVDIPSGICSDSGKSMGAMPTHLTVTFHRPKLGHYMSDGCLPNGGVWGCNKLTVVDIGLRSPSSRDVATLVNPQIRMLNKLESKHKFSHGHALILSGGVGHGGAARLAARGALRIGAGVATMGCPPSAVNENAAHLNAIMLRRVGDGAALQEVLADQRINALCLGPGMGEARAKALLPVALGAVRDEHAPYPKRPGVVLDADALTALAEEPELFAMLHDGCVLTPHGGEFLRLFPDIAARLAEPVLRGPAYSKVDATREAAARAGCVVLYKGADTVIAHPSGECSINSAAYERAAPWLATAGSGDVLAGFITGLLARGFNPMQAAETAAWLHVECARSFGPGLIAEDLPEELPKVFRSLGL